MTTTRTSTTRTASRARRAGFGLLLVLLGLPETAFAQLDPLLFLKRSIPTLATNQYRANVLLAVDTAPRMQYDGHGHYYDPAEYSPGNAYDVILGVNGANTAAAYRRKYFFLNWSASGPQKFNTAHIGVVGDKQGAAWEQFYLSSRIGVARAAIQQAVEENLRSTRFGLIRTRQTNPRLASPSDSPVFNSNAAQAFPTDGIGPNFWTLRRGIVDGDNRSNEAITPPLVRPDDANANKTVLDTVAEPLSSSRLLPAGNDAVDVDDAALAHMLEDVKAEAARLIAADVSCYNTVAVLITGGGEGTGGHSPTAAEIASTFTAMSGGRRVPVYVIAIAPPASAIPELKAIAEASGGQFFEVTQAEIDSAAAAGKVAPTAVLGINRAVQHAFAEPEEFNAPPTASLPFGPYSEFQVTSPVTGTVNLRNAKALDGSSLPYDYIEHPVSKAPIPQRANVMVTAGLALPNFEGRLRAYRVYKPEPDITKPAGYKFVADGTALWVARTPTAEHCDDASASCRNIFTALPNGDLVAFDESNAAVLSTYLNTWDVEGLIRFVRRQPLGAVVSSTPAFMDPPSLDPPPDEEYPAYAEAHKNRRTIVFVGANDGMFHAIDARTGVEVWAYIPFNLLPKLQTLRDGQPIDDFDYFVDSSTKVADVKIDGKWRTVVIFGQGDGGTFYQAFDATLDDMASAVDPESDSVDSLLSYFDSKSRLPLLWSFPRYSTFDWTIAPYGDVSAAKGASVDELSVGHTWSDPAVGQVETADGPFTVIVGSGFMPFSQEQQAHRNGVAAGRSLYLLDVGTGDLYDRADVGADGIAETDNDCRLTVDGCATQKNALQADPVATGPSDSRFITKSYIGDLDGNVWRFDVHLDGGKPAFSGAPVQLTTVGPEQPIFASMATVAVGTQQYLFFGTGSDLLPPVGINQTFKLVGVLDTGATGTQTFAHTLNKVDGVGDDEVVSAFPAVAGDIVFFTTTLMKPQNLCLKPDASLLAFTFVGSAAYDATGDNKVTANETPRLRTIAGAGRATAPFIVDQHLAFGTGEGIELFGDPEDFNNGVGHVGVRILSWRDLR